MPPPGTLIAAIDAYKENQQVVAGKAHGIKANIVKFASAFEFNRSNVVLHWYNLPTSLDDDAKAFITWLREQAYTVVHESTGLYIPEGGSALADERIANLENEKACMQARLATLQKSNAAIAAELQTIKAKEHDNEAMITKQDEEVRRLQRDISRAEHQITQKDADIADLRAEISCIKREGRARTSEIEHKETTIANMNRRARELADEKKALETENDKLFEENRRLKTTNRDHRTHQGTLDLLLAKTLPPIIMDVCRCIAPAAASILNSTGMSRVLKKRKRDDDDN